MPSPPAPVTAIERPAKPEISVPKLATAPKLDGDLSDPAWQGVPALGPLFKLGKTTPAGQQTTVQVGHDATNLYLGITCWEAHMNGMLAEYEPKDRDGNVFLDDSVEIFLQPYPNIMWHLAFNPLGAQYDARGLTAETENRGLNLPWTVAVQRKANRWTAEVAIPFSALAPDPPGSAANWGFNICRNEKPDGEISSWAPLTQAAFHRPAEFARLRFPQGPSAADRPKLDPHLIGCWSGDAIADGWARDRSGFGHHAQVAGNVKPVAGKLGAGFALAGGYLEIPPDTLLDCQQGLTFTVWLYTKEKTGGRIFDKGHVGMDDAYMMDAYPANNLRVITSRGGFGKPDLNLPLETWTHLALTYDNAKLCVYLNGELLDSRPGAGPLSVNTLPLRIGADATGGSQFIGQLDGLTLWNRALSADEVKGTMSKKW